MRYRFRQEDKEKLAAVRRFLADHLHEPVRVETVCLVAGMSRQKLKAGFAAVYGESIQDCLMRLRMEKARALVLETEESVALIAAACGYEHAENFSKAYRRWYGVVPRTDRRENGNEQLLSASGV